MQPLIKGLDFVCSKCRSVLKNATGGITICPHCGEITVPLQRVIGTVRGAWEGLCTRIS